MVLPGEWTDGERWLQRRLRRGEISGYKVGHVWRMTAADVDAMIVRYRNSVVPAPVDAAPRPLSFTHRSRRKLLSAEAVS